MIRLVRNAVVCLLIFLLGAAAIVIIGTVGGLSILGTETKTYDSQVVEAIERTEEVSLLSLQVQGVEERDQKSKSLIFKIPGSSKKVFIEYRFTAKLGIDGAKVDVTRTGEHAYRLRIPAFGFIGIDDVGVKEAASDGGPLSFLAPDIDKVDMVNEILSISKRDAYIKSNEDVLRSQATVFYKSLITSVDPGADVAIEFVP